MRGTISLAAHTAVVAILERQLASAQDDLRAERERYGTLATQILDMRHRDLTGAPKDFTPPATIESQIGPRTEMAIEHVAAGRLDLRAQQMNEAVRIGAALRADNVPKDEVDARVARMILDGEEP